MQNEQSIYVYIDIHKFENIFPHCDKSSPHRLKSRLRRNKARLQCCSLICSSAVWICNDVVSIFDSSENFLSEFVTIHG